MKKRKLCAILAAFTMVLTLLPTTPGTATVYADTTTASTLTSSENGMELSKTVTLEDDGTYSIDLEAYATGTTQTITTNEPTDIVLLLDVSTSMEENLSSTDSTTKISSLKTAATNFINTVTAKNAASSNTYTLSTANVNDEPTVYHKCASGDYSAVTWTYSEEDSSPVVTDGTPTQNTSSSTSYNDYRGENKSTTKTVTTTTTTITKSASVVTTTGTYTWTCSACGESGFKNVSYTKTTNKTTTTIQTDITVYTRSKTSDKWPTTGKTTTGNPTTTTTSDDPVKSDVSTAAIESSWNLYSASVSDTYRVSIIKFAGNMQSDKYNVGNDTYGGTDAWNYTQIMNHFTNDSELLNSNINAINPKAGTEADYGMELAKYEIENYSSSDRKKVIVFITDGEPNHWGNYWCSVAGVTINTAKALKDEGVTIFSIGIFDGADPDDIGAGTATAASRFNKYLNAVSSNYPKAYSDKTSVSTETYGGTSDGVINSTSTTQDNNIHLGTGSNQGYYRTVSTSSDWSSIFTQITNTVSSSTVTLDENSVLKDVMASGFDASSATVTVKTAAYNGNNSWSNEVDAGLTGTIDTTTGTVTVTGFSYKDNYVTETAKADGSYGKKLIVHITGVKATDASFTNTVIDTNASTSAIYATSDSTDPVAKFPQPKTENSEKIYVLDYAKTATLTDLPSDITKIVSNTNKITDNTATFTGKYGTVTADTYTPTTTKWNGYDYWYGFGTWKSSAKPSTVTTGNNTWTKISVLPANNVYYEDDFVTDSASGTVGITYTGTWTTVGTSNDNTADVEDDAQGWVTDLANDSTYSDGSAHFSETASSTAEFTFTGTGVDIYTRTDINAGMVMAELYKNGSSYSYKTYFCDNESASGTYYQIPTLSFGNLDYGTYKVVITVGADDEGHYDYYIDGIRVYNPLSSDVQSSEVVSDAYGSDEVNVTFLEVRDILLAANIDSTDLGSAGVDLDGDGNADPVAVFIDKIPDTVEGNKDTDKVTTELGTYETYGPENEVYLAKNQAIVFKVDSSVKSLQVGLKAPSGTATTAKISNGYDSDNNAVYATPSINAASDMYYEIKPDKNGYVMISNTGDGLLSITKLKCQNSDLASMSVNDALDTAENSVTYHEVAISTPTEDSSATTTVKDTYTKFINNLMANIKKLFGRR